MRTPTLALVAVLSLGCGTNGSNGAGGPATTLTPDAQTAKFCADVVGPFCDALFACCADPQVLGFYGGSADACRTKFASSCKKDIADVILPVAQAGATVLDEGRLGACVATLDAMKAGGAACTRPPQYVALEDCVAAFRGQLAPGAACDSHALSDIEFVPCAGGTCKNGACSAYLAPGAACDPATNAMAAGGCDFPDGYTCSGTGTAGQCAKRGAAGETCDATDFSCESATCLDGKCVLPTADTICKGN